VGTALVSRAVGSFEVRGGVWFFCVRVVCVVVLCEGLMSVVVAWLACPSSFGRAVGVSQRK